PRLDPAGARARLRDLRQLPAADRPGARPSRHDGGRRPPRLWTQRGLGHALGIPSLAWALLEVLDALGLERVVLVCNSMGGPVSLEVAHSAPERVAGVVLASPAGGMHNQPLI